VVSLVLWLEAAAEVVEAEVCDRFQALLRVVVAAAVAVAVVGE
jgi:hypothetical protein